MASNSSSLVLGIAVGAAIGAFAQHFYSSNRGKKLRHKACCKWNKMRDKAEQAVNDTPPFAYKSKFH